MSRLQNGPDPAARPVVTAGHRGAQFEWLCM